MSKNINDLWFAAMMSGALFHISNDLSQKGKSELPIPTVSEDDDLLSFSMKAARYEAQRAGTRKLMTEDGFFEALNRLVKRVSGEFGGTYSYIKKKPTATLRMDASSMSALELQEKYRISRSYAYKLRKEALKK